MKVYIVRHGQTYFNVMGRVQGWCDSPLTKQGIQQAEHLASYFESIPLASGYHSGSERAADTLDLILKDREVPRKRDKRFKEVFFWGLRRRTDSKYLSGWKSHPRRILCSWRRKSPRSGYAFFYGYSRLGTTRTG